MSAFLPMRWTAGATMSGWNVEFFRSIVDSAPEGIVICEHQGKDYPVVYANAAFERLSGYSLAELIGADLRRLQGNDREQHGRQRLRRSLEKGESARALLRNYRKDGTQFWNEIFIEPLRDASGAITHVVGFHRDIGERARDPVERVREEKPKPGLPSWMREDRTSGLYTRAYFEELLQHDWRIAQREARVLTMLMFDIDALAAYNDTFGRVAGDACIRRVASVIAGGFRRGSDVVARWEGGSYCALVRAADAAQGAAYAASVSQRVLEQHIHHPRATRSRFVTVSASLASLVPLADQPCEVLVLAATRALKRSQAEAGHIAVATAEDYRAPD
jgi:diguanylate cyclase (GGDEF)-like protein/PAS domain S-box-containing protein